MPSDPADIGHTAEDISFMAVKNQLKTQYNNKSVNTNQNDGGTEWGVLSHGCSETYHQIKIKNPTKLSCRSILIRTLNGAIGNNAPVGSRNIESIIGNVLR